MTVILVLIKLNRFYMIYGVNSLKIAIFYSEIPVRVFSVLALLLIFLHCSFHKKVPRPLIE